MKANLIPDPLDRIRAVKDIPALIAYLRDELDWPIEAEDFDELTFEYEPAELGIDARTAARIEEIKQLRPLAAGQPWGVFFIRFEPKRLPIVVLRRILSQLVVKKRAAAEKSHRAAWNLHDLLFISNYGEDDQRQITFAHFTQDAASGDLPTLKVLGWDDADTALHISHVHHELKEKLHWPDDEKDLAGWRERWASAFTLRHRQVITTSKDLAIHLADLARRIRRRAGQVLVVETERGPLRKLHKAFREALIHDLSEGDFADMYAQTIAYGLLAARVSRPMGIIAENVTDMVPVTNPFLRDMLGTFLTIGGRKGKMDFDELGIQDVVDLLNNQDTHMEAILRDFGNRTRQEDPVIHFYELFLVEYDKKMKVKRGVFYTPQPVVSYIVRSVHELLQTEFGLADGLADTTTWREMAARFDKTPSSSARELSSSSLPLREGLREGESVPFKIPEGVSPDTPFVQILDIATGTATFLVEVIDIIHKTMTAKWIREKRLELEFDRLWNEYVPKHLLPRLYGYELMMAPYAIAHMKIGLKLFETGYRFCSDERVHVYLTNALEPPSILAEQAAANLFEALGDEAQAVNAVKRDKRFTVVIGNPPYSNFGQMNRIPIILDLLEDYKSGLEERKLNLDDDYIKFIRFGHHLVETAKAGVFGMIANNVFLDGITHRQMRNALHSSFSLIAVCDLHGSVKKLEEAPDGSKDENVFDIQQGVGITFLLKFPTCLGSAVHFSELWGRRETKYAALTSSVVALGQESALVCEAPYYFFTPKVFAEEESWNQWLRIPDMMPTYATGVKTHLDKVFVGFSACEIEVAIADFLNATWHDVPISSAKRASPLRKALLLEKALRTNRKLSVTDYGYRAFDTRKMAYLPTAIEAGDHRYPVMKHLLSSNVALATTRQLSQGSFAHVLVTRSISDMCLLSTATKECAYLFPLRLLQEEDLLETCRDHTNLANPAQDYLKQVDAQPDEFLHYAYAVFHSPTYRTRYAEFLKIDFPRLPLTSSLELFRELARLGGELVALHLVESPVQTGISIQHDKTGGWSYAYATQPPVCVAFTGPAEPVVDKVGWSEETVWIDAVKPKKGSADAKVTGTVGFRGAPEEVWNFHIGGYQVCEKWLKDRKGRRLDGDDLIHYHRIVVALHETIRLMAEIDRVIDAHGGWPRAFMANQL